MCLRSLIHTPTRSGLRRLFPVLLLAAAVLGVGAADGMAQTITFTTDQINSAVEAAVAEHGEDYRADIETGVRQVATYWRETDGDLDEMTAFCVEHYMTDESLRQQTADRLENQLTDLFGHFTEMSRELSWYVDIDEGPMLPIDYMLAGYSPAAHYAEDMFKSRIAFLVLLNFPLYSLEEKLRLGPDWAKAEWAHVRLADGFDSRLPAGIRQQTQAAFLQASQYIDGYNIHMHHVLTPEGERLFPEGIRLISHWNLRDELKSQYAVEDGLKRQEMIYGIMLRIIRQEIPEVVIDNPAVDWYMDDNKVVVSDKLDGEPPAGWDTSLPAGETVGVSREPDTRYAQMLGIFNACRLMDPYFPSMPTMVKRRFERSREMLESDVEKLLVDVLGSPVVKDVGRLIEQRLGRELQPFDIWYDGFKQRSQMDEEKLTRAVSEKYPDVDSFEKDVPRILGELGFTPDLASFLAANIDVDPSRGAGHASGPGRRSDKAHLRTRIPATGMDYKGYNIAVHELGHNVEQILSLHHVDHTMLRGVPSTAITEAFAFLFQSRDLELLGMNTISENTRAYQALDQVWSTFEIAGVSLVDMRVWRWMYDHPEATPAELREAVIAIAKDVWNEFFAPVLGVQDVELLAVYSHMVSSAIYLPSYTLGHLIAFQIEEYMRGKDLAAEMERMCSLGNVTPDLWMKQAVGAPISAEPLLQAAQHALQELAY